MTFDIITVRQLSYSQTDWLTKLCAADSYEPYLDFDTPYYIAVYNSKPIGFLSYIINDYDNHQEIELTAITENEFRHKGVFSALFKRASKDNFLGRSTNKDFICIASRPNTELLHDSVNKNSSDKRIPIFTEYFMRLDKPNWAASYKKLILPDSPADYETCYTSEMEDEFLLYENPAADEPAAVCCLSKTAASAALYGVYVEEDCRNKGFGLILLYELFSDFFEHYSMPIVLNVRSTNTAAVKLYKKCGFTIESRINYYQIL